jgi:23S rRNA (guanosine2251-2'-O)-methyltransferase
MGKRCINEVLEVAPERIVQAYTTKEESDHLGELERRGIPIKRVTREALDRLVSSPHHQSLVLEVKEVDQHEMRTYVQGLELLDTSLILMLDSITDPNNLGAILRAAECFGVDCVIWSRNRGVDITPAVSKVSVGASELVTVIRVSNLVEAAKQLKEVGYTLVASAIDKSAVSTNSYIFPRKAVLMMGSEEKGLHALLAAQADETVYIPMKGRIDSLNVSQATAALLLTAARCHDEIAL